MANAITIELPDETREQLWNLAQTLMEGESRQGHSLATKVMKLSGYYDGREFTGGGFKTQEEAKEIIGILLNKESWPTALNIALETTNQEMTWSLGARRNTTGGQDTSVASDTPWREELTKAASQVGLELTLPASKRQWVEGVQKGGVPAKTPRTRN